LRVLAGAFSILLTNDTVAKGPLTAEN